MIHVALLFVLYSWIPLTPHPPKKKIIEGFMTTKSPGNSLSNKRVLKNAFKENLKNISFKILNFSSYKSKGDFAVLLKNGMTIRQAILCNCVSSVLSFVGMAVGLAIGNIGQSSLWIFAGIAGMFLYISLVDLVSI